MHWLLDVEFEDDLSRYRTGHGAKNMAIVRRFALNLVRAEKTQKASKHEENQQVGIQPFCSRSSNEQIVNHGFRAVRKGSTGSAPSRHSK